MKGSTPAIDISGLHKSFHAPLSYGRLFLHPFAEREAVEVLRGVDLTLEPREILGLVGVNGAGKSTLLKIIASLVIPDSGTVAVNGRDICASPGAAHCGIGYVLSNERSFFWRLSAEENLLFFATLNNILPPRFTEKVEEIGGLLGIHDLLKRPFRELSDGNRQRLAIARALMTDPDVLVVDEMTKSLDPRASNRLLNFLRQRLVEEQKRSILLVSHNLGEIDAVCDRMALLSHGVIDAVGPIDDMRSEIRRKLELE